MYAELCCKTNYSFLQGASHGSELVERAAELGLKAIAITDLNGVYGIPRAFRASREFPAVKLITGAEVTLRGRAPIIFLAQDRKGYGLLCRILTASHANAPKGEAALDWKELLTLLERPGHETLIAIPKSGPGIEYGTLKEIFRDRIFVPLARHLDGRDQVRTELAKNIRDHYGIEIIATNDVHYHVQERRILQDAMVAIHEGATLQSVGRRVFSNAERYLKSPKEMIALFRDMPEAIQNTLAIAERCTFSPGELRYRYPSEWIPKGETALSYLRRLTYEGAAFRYSAKIPEAVRRQLEHELKLVDELQFSDYFLTIWEIVEFAKSRQILCQGRGSAANSAICYCLGITAIDPIRMNLLFERFISAERGEPPDIDVDFEHERREEVIQHIYEKYGRDRAAMVSAVVTYRNKLSIREMLKVIPTARPELAEKLAQELYGFPRHLSIHSGGFTLSADPIIETVPVEPARMEGRTIVQWDKEDLETIGLLKVDILSLGMLTALRKTMDLVGGLTLATIPAEDPKTYQMIQRADTVGVFQIESRAQMSMLPRLLPRTFYDLVIQIAIVRPGPIVGKMVHPYLRRRRGLEAPDMPHPKLKPILTKTLGVPLFQEQVMKIAIELAGFTPGEADELRRAIGAWRSTGSIDKVGKRLMAGLLSSGLPHEFVERIFQQIQGFAEYGFPESHSASFALLAYASCYLKCHHPAEFACALINSQPMGFYSIHTLVDDAKRHHVKVLPVHPNRSEWDCTMEEGALRLGFRVVHGLWEAQAQALVQQRKRQPFASLQDFLTRSNLREDVLHTLALGDAFLCFGFDQRHALWELLAYQVLSKSDAATGQLNLFAETQTPGAGTRVFAAMDTYTAIQSDYQSYGLSIRGHPMQALRSRTPDLPALTAIQGKALPKGRYVKIAGLVIVRQRPPTANGTTFATLEDETGFFDLILHREVFERYTEIFLHHSFMIAEGVIQRDGNAVSMLVKNLKVIKNHTPNLQSRDFA